MEISIQPKGLSTLMVNIGGRLDLDSAVDFGHQVMDAIDNSVEKVEELILDFSSVTFISSFGLKVILELYKKMTESGGILKIKDASEDIKKNFSLVGFDKFLILE